MTIWHRERSKGTSRIEASPGLRLLTDRAQFEGAVCRAMRFENAISQRAAKRIACYEQMVIAGDDLLIRARTPHQNRAF
jgi:hypothetical protein